MKTLKAAITEKIASLQTVEKELDDNTITEEEAKEKLVQMSLQFKDGFLDLEMNFSSDFIEQS